MLCVMEQEGPNPTYYLAIPFSYDDFAFPCGRRMAYQRYYINNEVGCLFI